MIKMMLVVVVVTITKVMVKMVMTVVMVTMMMMVVMMAISGGVLGVVVDRDKVLGEKNSPLLPHSSSKEDSLGPWAFTLLLREMIKDNQKQPENLNWLPKESD